MLTTRRRPAATPGEAATPRSSPAPVLAVDAEPLLDHLRGDAPEHDRDRLGDALRRRAERRRRASAVRSASRIPLRRSTIRRPVARAAGRGTGRPAGVQVVQRRVDLVAVQVEDVLAVGEEAVRRRRRRRARAPCSRTSSGASARRRSCGSRRTGRPGGRARRARGRPRGRRRSASSSRYSSVIRAALLEDPLERAARCPRRPRASRRSRASR